MTVCIAAVCENGSKIVVASDRMFSAPAPLSLQFETDEKKIEILSPTCVTLIAGNSALATEIIRATKTILAGAHNPLVESVAKAMHDSYTEVRLAKVREFIIIPNLGPDFIRAELLGVSIPQYLQQQQSLYQQLVTHMSNFNVGVDIVVAGTDDGGARIAVITHPGTTAWFDKLGHAAIGSGGIHANMRLALGAQTSHSTLADTLYRVYEAKRASEVAPGVGQATDIVIVDGTRSTECSRETLTALKEIFEESGGRVPAAASLERIVKLVG